MAGIVLAIKLRAGYTDGQLKSSDSGEAAMSSRAFTIASLALVLALTVSACGCSTKSASPSDQSAAAAAVRASIPPIEAWYQDHNSYSGATTEKLRETYDPGITATLVSASGEDYCVEATVGSASAFKSGPAGAVMVGSCADKAHGKPYTDPETETDTSSIDSDPVAAQTYLRASIPAIEAWYQDHNSYTGMTLAKLRSDYDAGLVDIRLVTVKESTYCIELGRGDATFHKAGPAALIKPGSCPA
jgi:hypothetical protein